MKKTKLLGMLTLAVSSFGLIAGVKAETETMVNDWTSLFVCAGSSSEATVCKLEDDIAVGSILVGKAVTIDLNQHTLTLDPIVGRATDVRIETQTDGPVVITNGKIVNASDGAKSIITVTNSNGSTNTNLQIKNVEMSISSEEGFGILVNQQAGATITIDAESSITSANRVAMVNYGTSTINVYGKVTSQNTGSAIEGSYDATGATNINIFAGAKVSSAKGVGILQMSTGNVNVNGGEIFGNSGIALTKGNLNVKGGSIKGTGENVDFTPSADETIYDNGAAVYIEPTASVVVDIEGGELVSEKSYAVSAPASTTANENLTISIEKGTFESALGGIEINDAEEYDREAFIEPGVTFTQNGEPDNSVLEYTNGLDISESGVVGTIYTITTEKTENGQFTVNKDAAVGETVKVNVEPAEGYKLGKISVTYEVGDEVKEVEVAADGSFVMPEANVKVNVTFEKVEVPATDVEDNTTDENPKTIDNIVTYGTFAIISLGSLTIVSKKVLNK